MSKASYVLFECYSENVLIFRSYTKLDGDVIPVPLSDPHFQWCQSVALEQRRRLSYEFISGRLTKTAAVEELQRRNAAEAEKGSLTWLTCSGTRLAADSFQRVQ